MSLSYRPVGWNANKRRYDLVAAGALAIYLAVFSSVQALARPELTLETVIIRALGSAALLMLHAVLCIGPAARLDPRVLPILYNRRHLGVMTFLVAGAHGVFALVQFHALGTIDPLVNVLAGGRYDSVGPFPFQPLGLAALGILFVMAATSHDFWLHNLTAPVWKAIHMSVYAAYALVVLHVLFGVVQRETDAAFAVLLGAGALTVLGLHAAAALKEARRDREPGAARLAGDGFVDVCSVDDIAERRAVITCLSGERVAVFRYDGKIAALSNVCQHQNGPLGEGRIIGDCVVCPWHGYEYLPESGASPAPFTERVPTFNVRITAGRVAVHPRPNPPGTRVPPARIAGPEHAATSPLAAGATATSANGPDDEFYVGYAPPMPPRLARLAGVLAVLLCGGAAVAAVLVATSHVPLEGGTFEFGHPRDVSGMVVTQPYPAIVPDGNEAGAAGAWTLLVAPGKHGANAVVAGLSGARVRLEGTRIERDGQRMLEVTPGSVTRTAGPAGTAGAPVPERGGTVTLAGEIVDTKCYLGVMVPGSGNTHARCASLCLRGGIPPGLLVRDREGRSALLLLEGPHGASLTAQATALAGQAIEATGVRGRRGGWLTLQTDPATWRRLPQNPPR